MPGMHRQGIGTMILREIIKLARDKGYDGIRLLAARQIPLLCSYITEWFL
jgi:GNAT superfamily N-acetyltransferase